MTMNRRDMFAAGVGLGIAALSLEALADDQKAADPRSALLDALSVCLAKAQLCAAHCQNQLASGARDFAHCNAAVNDLLVVTPATAALVARQSPNAKKMADTCAAVCKECSAACLEHKPHFAHGMHMECKACMDACDACAKACATFTAS
jgi:Cys-rich four helix bundle protein (predicted Tat secretion target)